MKENSLLVQRLHNMLLILPNSVPGAGNYGIGMDLLIDSELNALELFRLQNKIAKQLKLHFSDVLLPKCRISRSETGSGIDLVFFDSKNGEEISYYV